jgi:SAM-dependent methyltransferase
VVAIESNSYVLGTSSPEIVRLGQQHGVWREAMLGAWRRAGLRRGWRVVDVGAGPGYATVDLSDLVGPDGHVAAVERAPDFVRHIREQAVARRLTNVEVHQLDLMDSPPPTVSDMVWCRWVASFVADVATLVRWVDTALTAQGVAVFHEYVDYASWRFAPPRERLAGFVNEVMRSWRDTGGEPDIAPTLIRALRNQGFDALSVRPLVFATSPGGLTWQWPAGFVQTNAERLQALGRVTREWVDGVMAELRDAEADPETIMITPMVLEIIARRR